MVAVIIGGGEAEDGETGALLVEGGRERFVLEEGSEREVGAL